MRASSAVVRQCYLYSARARPARCALKQIRTVCVAAIVAAFALVPVGARADSIKIGGTGLGTMKLMAQEFNKYRPDAQLMVTPSLGSTGAIRAVLAGTVDIGISARPVTPEERRQGATSRAYARTPFVVATGAKNRGAGLTLAQLVQSYSGQAILAGSGNLASAE